MKILSRFLSETKIYSLYLASFCLWSVSSLNSSTQLDIAPRKQWDNNNGYCGETSIQQAALYFGCYISQYQVRNIINPTQRQDVWIPENSDPIFDAMGFSIDVWNSHRPPPQYPTYLGWIKSHLHKEHPVIFNVFIAGETDSDYDHIMLATGFRSVDADQYHDEDVLIFNDNYSRTPYERAFQTLWDTRSMKDNGAKYDYCVPRDVDYGCAVTGIKTDSTPLFPVSIKIDHWDEPNITRGAQPIMFNASITIRGLSPGNRYILLRFDDYHQIKASNYLNLPSSKAFEFTAEGNTHSVADTFASDSFVIYRCVSCVQNLLTTPLFRFFRSDNGSHFFTASPSEKASILEHLPGETWHYEGECQKVLMSNAEGAVPVYRLYNRVSGCHFYTLSQAEIDSVLSKMGEVFQLEGVAFYAFTTAEKGAVPVYRFFAPRTASHFFTIDENEKNDIIERASTIHLRFEGIAWYAYP